MRLAAGKPGRVFSMPYSAPALSQAALLVGVRITGEGSPTSFEVSTGSGIGGGDCKPDAGFCRHFGLAD